MKAEEVVEADHCKTYTERTVLTGTRNHTMSCSPAVLLKTTHSIFVLSRQGHTPPHRQIVLSSHVILCRPVQQRRTRRLQSMVNAIEGAGRRYCFIVPCTGMVVTVWISFCMFRCLVACVTVHEDRCYKKEAVNDERMGEEGGIVGRLYCLSIQCCDLSCW